MRSVLSMNRPTAAMRRVGARPMLEKRSGRELVGLVRRLALRENSSRGKKTADRSLRPKRRRALGVLADAYYAEGGSQVPVATRLQPDRDRTADSLFAETNKTYVDRAKFTMGPPTTADE